MVEECLRKPENRWRSAKRWTEWEDALLKKHFPKEGIRMAPMLPGRTRAAIQDRARNLGIRRSYALDPVPKEPVQPHYVRKRKVKHI